MIVAILSAETFVASWGQMVLLSSGVDLRVAEQPGDHGRLSPGVRAREARRWRKSGAYGAAIWVRARIYCFIRGCSRALSCLPHVNVPQQEPRELSTAVVVTGSGFMASAPYGPNTRS